MPCKKTIRSFCESYKTQTYWITSPAFIRSNSIVANIHKKHCVSEATCFRPQVKPTNSKKQLVSRFHLRMEAGSFRNVALVLNIGDNGRSPCEYWWQWKKSLWILVTMEEVLVNIGDNGRSPFEYWRQWKKSFWILVTTEQVLLNIGDNGRSPCEYWWCYARTTIVKICTLQLNKYIVGHNAEFLIVIAACTNRHHNSSEAE
jgi:hypothetical protein